MGHGQPRTKALAALVVAVMLGACGPKPAPADPKLKSVATDEDAERLEAAQVNAIARAVNEFGAAVHTCWARAAADDFRLEGRVTLAVELGQGGMGEKVSVVEESVGDPVLVSCLVSLWQDYRWADVFAAGDRIQLPPFEFVAPQGQNVVASAHVEAVSLADGNMRVQVLLDPANCGNSQAALSLLSIGGGLQVPMHTHTSAEVLYILEGTGALIDADGRHPVSPGSAVFIGAGAPHAFQHTGTERLVAAQLYSPAGPEQRFKNPKMTAGTSPAKDVGKKSLRPLRRETKNVSEIPLAKGTVRILFDEGASNEAAHLGALTLNPNSFVAPHRHEASEYFLILEGHAELTVSGQLYHVQAGDALQIPPGVLHSIRVGDAVFKGLQMYSPSGPEQRFKERAK